MPPQLKRLVSTTVSGVFSTSQRPAPHWIALSSRSDTALAAQPADPQLALAWWALSHTPRVAMLDEAVLMEVSTSERLWGGRARLLERIFKTHRPPALLHAAVAATSLEALGLLRLTAHGTARPTALPEGLPLSVLTAARRHLPVLARLGCRTWSDLRALPRAGVARRFGAELLRALDIAWGEQPDMHVWLTLPERFDATFELPALTQDAPALLFGAQRLLHQLRSWLAGRQLGVLAFELDWLLDARRTLGAVGPPEPRHVVIRTARATQDVAHLQRLLSERLAGVRLPAPAHALRLRSRETAPLAPRSEQLLPEQPGQAADFGSLQQLAERLRARLGPERVLQLVPLADHRPECMQRWQPVADAMQLTGKAHRPGSADLRHLKNGNWLPTWLLREPLPLATLENHPCFYGPLQLLAGPDRLEVGWWTAIPADEEAAAAVGRLACGPALRDYFIAHDAQAGLLWVYRERLRRAGTAARGTAALSDGCWFLQGLYA